MRNLFFALVFANFVFAAGTLWHGDPPRASAAALDRGVPIQLVSEVDPRSVDTLSAGEPSADARSDELGSAVQQPVEQPSVLPRPVAPPRDSDAASSALAALEPSL